MINTVHRCTACGRVFESLQAALEHDKMCRLNPDNRCCETCARLYDDKTLDADYFLQAACTKLGHIKDMDSRPFECPNWRDK